MLETLIDTLGGPNVIWWLAAAYFGMVLSERVFYVLRRPGLYDDRDALCSIGLNLMNNLIHMVVGFLVPVATYVLTYQHFRLFTLDTLWIAIPVAFVVHELSYYAEHRLSHRVGLLWAFHAIHHSSNEFNHSTAARGFVLDAFFQGVFGLAAALLGVAPVVYVVVAALKSVFGIWNHASYVGRLGWLDSILATPLNHKVHHAIQPQYIDKNYSQVLIIWDRIFGTFEPCNEPPVVGLVNPVHDNNPLTAQFAGLKQLGAKMRRAQRWQDKLAYLWRPPEWSHDGRCAEACPKYAASVLPAE